MTEYTSYRVTQNERDSEASSQRFYVGGGYSSSYSIPGPSYSVYGAPIGTSRVFYGTKKGRGFWLPNPCLTTKVAASCLPVHCTVGRYWYVLGRFHPTFVISGDVAATVANNWNYLSVPSVPSLSQEQALLFEAQGRAKEAAADILTTLAELPETVDMFRVKGENIGRMLKKLRPRPSIRMLGSWLKYASDAWLQYRYGIMPLLMEADTYRELFAQKANFELDKPFRESTRGPGEHVENYMVKFVRASSTGPYLFGFDRETSRYQWTSTVYSKKSMSMFAKCGVNWSSLPKTVWELVPYSFLVDWFIDVGGWLDAALPNPSVTVVDQTLSYKKVDVYDCLVQQACQVSTPSDWYIQTPCYSRYTQTRQVYKRSLNLPNPGLPPLTFGGGLDRLKRSLDAAALTYGRIDRKLIKR